MAEGKRYYWLKLKDDFFGSKRIKKLRKLAGGDTFLVIYLKMQLLAIHTDGILTWAGLEESFADELALDLDESPEDVKVVLMYLLNTGLAETQDDKHFFFPYAVENTGSETASAQRVREYRENQKLLHCNTDVTQVKRSGNVEIDIEKEKDIEIEKETEKVEKRKRFQPPTVDDVSTYCNERGNNIDPQHFVDYYAARGWMIGKNHMKDWKAAVRTWEKSDKKTNNIFLEILEEENR